MGHKKPGPLCSTRVGDEWIDDGTLCRSKSPAPGSTGAGPKDAAKEAYDKAHVYSLAPEARRKRAIDLEIIARDYTKGVEIRIDNGDYLKKLIELASDGKYTVHTGDRHKSLQFFIIRGRGRGVSPRVFEKHRCEQEYDALARREPQGRRDRFR